MIIKQSDGFLSVLGSFPVHIAMLLTMLGTVKVPRDESNQMREDSLSIYT